MKKINNLKLRRISCMYASAILREITDKTHEGLQNIKHGDKKVILPLLRGSKGQKYRNAAKIRQIMKGI